ncbi:MAG: peptidoglycan-binding protein [candidate division SR1 bacterium]|nr:peptidoglycan-binding protein [candidate division SR1 bacterium]
MKKRIFMTVICFCLGGATNAFEFSACQEKQFTVTAYYSPESGQAFYYKPSFQEEVTLNGQGYVGASGKEVFNGMLAGPASYPFGSVIYFPGLGVGEVADRGGAIVLSGERGQSCDRIDVWMGRGEEGLIRALTFGKKNMTGYFCDCSIVQSPPKDTLLRENVPVLKNFFDIAVWIEQLEPGRSDIWTRTLQKYLVKLGYLNKKYRNGNYEEHTKKALCTYQVSKKIISSRSPDCGVFGKMTRYIMKMDMQSKGLLPQNLYATGTFANIIDGAKYYNGVPEVRQGVVSAGVANYSSGGLNPTSTSKMFLFYRAYIKGQQSSEIKILQKFLQSQGVYSGTIDGVYSKGVAESVYNFQKKYSLISDTDSWLLRGFLGPKTRSKINELRQK